MPTRILSQVLERDGHAKIYKVRLRLEDGAEVERDVEHHGEAVAVLPYDPARRVAMLIRVMRPPALVAAGLADLLEAPAGMIEKGSPADTVRREAREEVGLQLGELDHIARVWTSPGVSTERLDLYLAIYSEADRVSGGGGSAREHENITVLEISLPSLWSMVEKAEIEDHKLLTLALVLKLRRPELFE